MIFWKPVIRIKIISEQNRFFATIITVYKSVGATKTSWTMIVRRSLEVCRCNFGFIIPRNWSLIPNKEMFSIQKCSFCLFFGAVYFISPHKTKIGQSLYIPLTWILVTRMFKTLFINYFVTYRRAGTDDVIIGWNSFPTWTWCRTATHSCQLETNPLPTFHFIFRFSLFSVVSKNRKNLEIFIRKVSLE